MISSFPSRSSISPFRKSFNLDRDEAVTTESNTKKPKRQSLRIITGVDSHQSNSSISSPSRVRQRLSSLFRSSSPVVMTLKETFSNSNLSQDHSCQTKRQASFSTVSFASVAEQSQEQPPTLLQSLGDNNSSTTLSSSSEASDHMPASPADGAATTAANTFTHHHRNSKSITDPSFWQPHSIKSNMMSLSYEAPPPSPPPHKEHQPSLAYQVHQILGSALDEVDEEIEQDWEDSRNKLRQSLLLPKTCERIY
ncbi:uncharacterized protein ATC70_007611 [Mucor velutinosus]|uniref:Uncharacterized protein n=1 Tax=Mucor velutinosus TaxID=708070 RepID=A0AAN7D7A8_9FUNG|nr:hypothetical protein ATC70_007611 [Mucor velutinosus]